MPSSLEAGHSNMVKRLTLENESIWRYCNHLCHYELDHQSEQ